MNKSIVEELVGILGEKRIVRYWGHVVRRNEENLEKNILSAKLHGSKEKRKIFLPGWAITIEVQMESVDLAAKKVQGLDEWHTLLAGVLLW